MHRRFAAGGSALAVTLAVLVALPGSASADEPAVTTTDDSITYADPSLVGEATTTVQGTLRVVAVDRVDGGEYRYSVETDDGQAVPLEVADDLPTSAANGAIEAEVVDPESSSPQLAEATVEPDAQATAAATPAPLDHRAYVVRVTGMGGVLPSAAAAETRLEQQVLDEWAVESDGVIPTFAVDTTAKGGVKDISLASTGQTKAAICAMDRPERLWNQAAEKFPNVELEPTEADPRPTQDHLVVLVSGCTGDNDPLGVGTVGTSISDGGASTLSWNTSYVDATGVHELGHNFGLGHANVRPCGACAALEYADIYSVMGFGIANTKAPALDSAFRDRLGITQPGEVRALRLDDGLLSETTTVQLSPRGLRAGTRAISVIDPVSGAKLWIEFRIGYDRDAGSAYFDRSVSGYQFFEGVTVSELSDDGELALIPRDARQAGVDFGSTFQHESGGVSFGMNVSATGHDDVDVKVTLQRGVPKIVTGGAIGSARVGAAASAQVDDWPEGTKFDHSWMISDTEVSDKGTYTPASIRRGQKVRLVLRAAPPGQTTQTRTSAPVTIGYGRITGPSVKTTGTTKVGSTLRAVADTVRTAPSASYSYRWYRSTSPISGAVSSSYKLTSADKGKRVRVQVVARKTGYAQLIRNSPYVGPTK